MLSRKQGLKNKDIQKISRKGKKILGDGFVIKVWYDYNLSSNKFAISISTKLFKKAVKRNRVRRLFRAAIYNLDKGDNFKKGSYLFIVTDPNLLNLKSTDLESLIKKAISST